MSVAQSPTTMTSVASKLPIFYPSHIKLYLECPERYYHKYVARRRVREPFSRALARGIALHAVLADCFAEFRAQRAFPVNVRERAAFEFQQLEYPPELAASREDDIVDVTALVKWALSQFDGVADVLGVEETLGHHHPGHADSSPFLLRAKVDLTLAHPDGVLEHMDFKGGRAQRDPIQEIISRIVVGANVGDRYPVIKTTTIFAAEEKIVSEELTRDACRETWGTIKRAVRDILSGSDWSPSPSPLCSFCPYFGNGCSAAPAPAQATAVVRWLEGED